MLPYGYYAKTRTARKKHGAHHRFARPGDVQEASVPRRGRGHESSRAHSSGDLRVSPTSRQGEETEMNDEKKDRRGWKRGDGAVRKNHGSWYVRYAVGGKRVEERIDAKTEREARKILRKRLTGVEEGIYLPEASKTRVSDLFEDMKRD